MRDMGEPYILPVRLDDTPLPGLHSTTAWVDGRKKTAVEVADLTIEHLRLFGRDVAPPPAQREMAQRVSVRAIPGRTLDGRWEVPYVIHNGSSYPIHDAVLIIDDPGQEGRPEEQLGTTTEQVIGVLNAGEVREGRIVEHLHFTREPEFGELTHLAYFLFSDHWENHWAATGRKVTRLRFPPRLC